jgi:TRAP-type C4-dicarboxylate transport system substrate-binding protein
MTNKDRKFKALLAVVFIPLLICLSVATAIAAEPIKWRCQASIALASPTYKESIVRVADFVKERTNGRLVIDHHPAGAIIPNNEIFPSVKKGIIELGYATPGYWKTDIPLSQLCALPFTFTHYWEVLYFFKKLGFEKMLRDEVAKHDVFYYSDHVIPVEIVSKKPIRTIDDFKGKKIRTYGNFAKYISLLGASPVTAPGPEIYTGLATGVFDAAHWGAAVGAESLALYEVCKFHILPSLSLGTEEGWYVNKKALEKLPKDIQEVLTTVLEEQFWIRSVEYAYNEQVTLSMVQKKRGVEVITLPPDSQRKMAEIATKIWDEVATLGPNNAKGVAMIKNFLKDLGRL